MEYLLLPQLFPVVWSFTNRSVFTTVTILYRTIISRSYTSYRDGFHKFPNHLQGVGPKPQLWYVLITKQTVLSIAVTISFELNQVNEPNRHTEIHTCSLSPALHMNTRPALGLVGIIRQNLLQEKRNDNLKSKIRK